MATDSSSPEKLKNLLSDLGKATLRGVRKCPKCGTFNGTRGISCKNKQCDAVFKDRGDKRKTPAVEAVKIITGSTVQVFSVRLRDRGPDYRGFVQLPLVQDMEGNPAETVDVTLLEQNSKCYVDTCLRALAGERWAGENCCPHIRAAIGCQECAVPLTLKNSVLNSLNVTNEIKQSIWLLATETTGPLVQRVTKNIMVVKCKANNKQPLGFIHFAFFDTAKKGQKGEHKFLCSCRSFKSGKLSGLGPGAGEERRRCVHFYACICAFASDEKLSQEFAYYIDLDNKIAEDEAADASQFICTYVSQKQQDLENDQTTARSRDNVEIVVDKSLLLMSPDPKGTKRKAAADDDQLMQLEFRSPGKSPSKQSRDSNPLYPVGRKLPAAAVGGGVDATEASLAITFHQWLASVTERINQTMHYQFDGHPDPLVFHVPGQFFQCLQQRISNGHKKKRLPNATTGFIRRDALPLGVFTKYTWHITNVIHVKQIFDTQEMPLEVTRTFVENRDGTYDLYEPPPAEVADVENPTRKKDTPIRPFELRTYLKVGHMLPNQKEPTPFTIEWIPDILPQCHIGELRIKFEYGHQRNGHVEHRQTTDNLPVLPPSGVHQIRVLPNEVTGTDFIELQQMENIELQSLQDADI